MNFVFLMDPLSTVNFDKDTTFILMVGAKRKGHRIFYLPKGGITKVDKKFHFHVTKVVPQLIRSKPFVLKKDVVLADKDVDAIFIRTDPPFDQDYLHATWISDLLPKRIFVINDPTGIRQVNEKIWASQFTDWVPPTLIGRQKNDIVAFIKQHKDVIAKPTDGHGGKAVFRVKFGDKNMSVILETLTHHWKRDVIIQKYVKASVKGDKRILLLNGEPLGAVLRVHGKDDHRNNLFAGGSAAKAKITARELQMIQALKPKLKALGLYFVGIDILGDYLIEVNVTSPTCLQEMNKLGGLHLEDKVIDFVERSVNARKNLL